MPQKTSGLLLHKTSIMPHMRNSPFLKLGCKQEEPSLHTAVIQAPQKLHSTPVNSRRASYLLEPTNSGINSFTCVLHHLRSNEIADKRGSFRTVCRTIGSVSSIKTNRELTKMSSSSLTKINIPIPTPKM